MKKKCCIENIVYLEKILIPLHISYFFRTLFKYENNKKPDKTKLQKLRKPFLFIVPRIYFLNFS